MNQRSWLFQRCASLLAPIFIFGAYSPCASAELKYAASQPPLQVAFDVSGGHYNGVVHGGELFLQTDIAKAPVIRYPAAAAKKLYTLIMLDFDGNANGSWPDQVASGENSPVRHWIIGNIPGSVLRQDGYREASDDAASKNVTVIQPYRSPHIPMVSDRYGLYLFEQGKKLDFAPVTGEITNFDHNSFLKQNGLVQPVASNWFVAIYTSESPFSGKPFQGNDVSKTWHKGLGQGKLTE